MVRTEGIAPHATPSLSFTPPGVDCDSPGSLVGPSRSLRRTPGGPAAASPRPCGAAASGWGGLGSVRGGSGGPQGPAADEPCPPGAALPRLGPPRPPPPRALVPGQGCAAPPVRPTPLGQPSSADVRSQRPPPGDRARGPGESRGRGTVGRHVGHDCDRPGLAHEGERWWVSPDSR